VSKRKAFAAGEKGVSKEKPARTEQGEPEVSNEGGEQVKGETKTMKKRIVPVKKRIDKNTATKKD